MYLTQLVQAGFCTEDTLITDEHLLVGPLTDQSRPARPASDHTRFGFLTRDYAHLQLAGTSSVPAAVPRLAG